MNYSKAVLHGIAILSILLASLFALSGGIQFVHAISSVTDIGPTDDAYVAADSYDPQDKQGFQHVNTGHLPFLKAWYAWDVTKTDKQRIISVVYLKFNLTKVNGPIESASLILHPFVVNLTAPSRPIDVYTGLNNNWNESSIVFVGAPAFSAADNSTALINSSDINESVSWDITRQVRSHEGSFLTLALVIRNSYPHNEELVNFYSKEAADPAMRPDLIVTTQSQSRVMQSTGIDLGTALANSAYVYFTVIIAAIVLGFVVLKRKHMKMPKDGKTTTMKDQISMSEASDHSI